MLRRTPRKRYQRTRISRLEIAIRHARHSFVSHGLTLRRKLPAARDASRRANVSITPTYLAVRAHPIALHRLGAAPRPNPG
jgi:hypothetical protein